MASKMTEDEVLNSLVQIIHQDGNNKCIDCGTNNPDWASLGYSILICLECAGQHRALGVHISPVKSVTMDIWDEKSVQKLSIGGNKKFQEYLTTLSLTKGVELPSPPSRYTAPRVLYYRELLNAQGENREPTEYDEDYYNQLATQYASTSIKQLKSAPQWVPDAATNECMLCSSNFTLTNRRHHCRRCGICVCKKCAPAGNTRPISEWGLTAPFCRMPKKSKSGSHKNGRHGSGCHENEANDHNNSIITPVMVASRSSGNNSDLPAEMIDHSRTSTGKSLPYGGSIQEAIKVQDREAVKYLLSLRQQQNQQDFQNNNNDENESKTDYQETSTSLQDCLLSLGFSPIQLHEYFHHDDDDMTHSEALKTILDSEKHFPNPIRKVAHHKLTTNTHTLHELSCNEEQHVNPQMLRGLDPESTWTLLQCCVNYPTFSQLQIYELLTQLNSLTTVYLISQSACKWLRNVLIKGYVDEVKCILFNLDLLLRSDSLTSTTPPDQASSDQLLMSYMCPITREILVEPVTLQCGHNFSRIALEQALSSGNRRCPICKAAVTPAISEFAVNVILRDTIERLYPHVLLRRAVDDIQAAQRSGIKELRSVIRWLHNFPQSPEVVHAVITALTFWVRDTPDSVENRLKIIRDGHIAILCRIFSIVDVNSTAFVDLLHTLRLVAFPYSSASSSMSSSSTPSEPTEPVEPTESTEPTEGFTREPNHSLPLTPACQKIINTSTGSILTADIHVELMRIVSHKSKFASENECFQLLIVLLKGLENSEVHLRRFIQNSIRLSENISSPSIGIQKDFDKSSHNSPHSLLKTPTRNSLIDSPFPTTPTLTPSRSEKKDKEDRLLLLIRLIIERISNEHFTEIALSVCIRLLTLPFFTMEEYSQNASLLVQCGIVDAINSCFLHYMTIFDSPTRTSTHVPIYKLVMLLAKLSFHVNKTIRDRLNHTCQQYCLQILQSWHHNHLVLDCDVLFSTCEAIYALLFGKETSLPLVSKVPTITWLPHFNYHTVSEIVKLLEYRAHLQTRSSCSTFHSPRLVYDTTSQLEIRIEKMFSLIYLPHTRSQNKHSQHSQQQQQPTLVQFLPSSVIDIRISSDDENEYTEPARPLLIHPLKSDLDPSLSRRPSQFSLTLNLSSNSILPQQPVYLVITKSCDIDQFKSWISESQRGLISGDLNLPIPFVRVDLKTGTILRSNVEPIPNPSSSSQHELIEEFMPLSVFLADQKSVRLDISSNHLLLNVNGIQSQTYTFPISRSTVEQNSSTNLERSEEEKIVTECDDNVASVGASAGRDVDRDRDRESIGNHDVHSSSTSPSSSRSIANTDTVSRFLLSMLAANANERNIILSHPFLSSRPLSSQQSSGLILANQSLNSNSSRDHSVEDTNEGSDDLNLSVWLLYTIPETDYVEEEAEEDIHNTTRMIFVTSELDTIHEEDFEIATHGKIPDSKFLSIPITWEKIDDRFLRTCHGTGRVLFSHTQTVGIEELSEVTALSTFTTEGIHIYHFQILNQSSSCVVGLSTGDGAPFQSNDTHPLSLFSILYHSNGIIQLVVPTGLHPCFNLNETNPVIETDDSIVFELSQEDCGSIRIFHNEQLVFHLENLFQYICQATPLGAYISLSKPGDEISVDHYIPRAVRAFSGDAINWKLLKHCFYGFQNSLKNNSQEIRSLESSKPTPPPPPPLPHSSHSKFFEYFQLMTTFSSLRSQHPSNLQLLIQTFENISSFLLTNDPFSSLPHSNGSFDHNQPNEPFDNKITKPTHLLQTWMVSNPIAYDTFVSLVDLFTTIQRLCFFGEYENPFDSKLTPLKKMLINLAIKLIEREISTVRPHHLVNVGIAIQFASFIPKSLSNLEDVSLVMDILIILRNWLNSDISLSSKPVIPCYISGLASSGLILKLCQLSCAISNTSELKYLSRNIVVVLTEIMSRLKDHPPLRITDDWNREGVDKCLEIQPKITSTTNYIETNYFQNTLFLISHGQWNRLLTTEIRTSLSHNEFPSNFIDSFFDLCCDKVDYSVNSICFDHRTQSNSHIWFSKTGDRYITARGEKSITQGENYEIIPDINASSGNPSKLLLSGSDNYWTSGLECTLPHWIEVTVSPADDWNELQIRCPLDISNHPNAIRIFVGSTTEDLTLFRELNLTVSPHWQVLLLKSELAGIILPHPGVLDLLIRIEILSNISHGSTSRIDGLRLVGVFSSLPAIANNPLKVILNNSLTMRPYRAKDWIERLYFDLMDGNIKKIENHLIGKDLTLPYFTGYGPWLWGHPGNNGFIGLIIPCTIASAISQMIHSGLSSRETQDAFLRINQIAKDSSSSSLSSSNDTNRNSTDDLNANINEVSTRLLARYRQSNSQLISLTTISSHPHQTISTAIATIEAIRSLVREEQIRINQNSHAQSSEYITTPTHHQITPLSPTDSSAVLPSSHGYRNASSSMMMVTSSGPKEFTYNKADGMTAIFDASYEACAPYGLLHSQSVKSHRYPEIGVGVVIGVLENKLWIHLEKNSGATFRDDNWQYADLYSIASEGQVLTAVIKSSQLLTGRAININDRVRRGPNWSWFNQDLFAGNLGTVVEISEQDLWVCVKWDGGEQNTYRWGAEGCYDLEIVDENSESILLDRKPEDSDDHLQQHQQHPVTSENNRLHSLSINESLTSEERIRSTLWRGQNSYSSASSLLTKLYWDAVSSNNTLITTRCRHAMMAIAEYSIESARSLNLTLRDLSVLMESIVTPSNIFEQLTAAKFLSIICSSGLIYDLVTQQSTHGLSFPLKEILVVIKNQGPCNLLLLHSLRFLRDLTWLCSNFEPNQPNSIRQKFQFHPIIDHQHILNVSSPHSDFTHTLKTFYHDSYFLESLIDILIPIFHSHQSSAAIVMTLDIFSLLLLKYPNCIKILLTKNIDLYLINFSKELLELQMSSSLKMIFHQLMSLMLLIESHAGESLPSLLPTILVFAEIARDYHTILQTMQLNRTNDLIICRCVEILLGGRRKYHMKNIPSSNWRSTLTVGDRIDAKDKSQLWYESIIRNINEVKGEVFVHYVGWGTKYDEWIPLASDRIQLLHSETGYWRDNLRLDDPVEILCIHNEGAEVKRRWFRGIVTRVNENGEKFLVEYDKRGSHEERWVNISDEEICNVGTHVPSAIGSTTEIFRTLRKKQLLECNSLEIIVELLESQLHSVEITRACLEAIQYLILPPEGQTALLSCHIEQLLNQLGPLLGQCLEFYSKKSELTSFDGTVPTPSEDIVAFACDIINRLCTIPTFDSTATAATAPTTTTAVVGSTASSPTATANATGHTSSGSAAVDTPHHRNENLTQKFNHQFLSNYSNATNFIESIVTSGGYRILLNLLLSYGKIFDIQVLIPTISIFCTLIQLNNTWSPQIISLLVESGGMDIVSNLVNMLTTTRSSARLVTHSLVLLQHIASSSLEYKLTIFHMKLHETSIRCVSSFPNQPRVLAASLGLLGAIISRDGRFHYPQTLTSSGPFDFQQIKHSNKYLTHWSSLERLPSLDHPHWVEIPVQQGKNGWKELSLLLMDYGISSPESLSVFYRYQSDKEFFEVKRFTALDRSGDWCPFLTWEEVAELYEQWQEDPQTLTGQGTIRIEIPHNHNNGMTSFIGGLRILFPVETSNEIVSEEQRKDAISAMDGISMIVECLLQSKSSDRELYQTGRTFLQSFASNEQRVQFVVDCGGGYIL